MTLIIQFDIMWAIIIFLLEEMDNGTFQGLCKIVASYNIVPNIKHKICKFSKVCVMIIQFNTKCASIDFCHDK